MRTRSRGGRYWLRCAIRSDLFFSPPLQGEGWVGMGLRVRHSGEAGIQFHVLLFLSSQSRPSRESRDSSLALPFKGRVGWGWVSCVRCVSREPTHVPVLFRSPSMASESLLFACPKRSNQEKGHPRGRGRPKRRPTARVRSGGSLTAHLHVPTANARASCARPFGLFPPRTRRALGGPEGRSRAGIRLNEASGAV